jgi:HEAT repeat protein
VQLLADLRESAALDLFQSILAAPIPPEKAPDMITYSTVGEEVMIRTTAIEGITRLAATGDRRALELLREYAQHEVFSIKRAAVQGYLDAVGPKGREELRKILKKQDHFILDLRRTEVQNVPQPRVERPSTTMDEPPPARLLPPTIEE